MIICNLYNVYNCYGGPDKLAVFVRWNWLICWLEYQPIRLVNGDGAIEINVPNPSYVQLPIIKSVIHHLQGLEICKCTSVSATPVNWVLDRILGKF